MDLGIALEGFFFEKVNGSTGQRVTFLDTILYMIADDTRLSSLRPHHCKKHTVSFARSTGIFPSTENMNSKCLEGVVYNLDTEHKLNR